MANMNDIYGALRLIGGTLSSIEEMQYKRRGIVLPESKWYVNLADVQRADWGREHMVSDPMEDAVLEVVWISKIYTTKLHGKDADAVAQALGMPWRDEMVKEWESEVDNG